MPLATPKTRPAGSTQEVSSDATTVARRIISAKPQRVGFIPADPECPVSLAIKNIAVAVTQVSDYGVATIFAPAVLTAPGFQTVENSNHIWTMTRHGLVTQYVPSRAPLPGEWLRELGLFLHQSLSDKEIALIDFSGLREVGELEGATAMVDAYCVVVRAKKTKEQALERACANVPLKRLLGVLLTDG